MEQYGEFLTNIDRMERALGAASAVWTDDVGRAYMSVNDNINAFTQNMWTLFARSKQGYEAVKQNYRPSEIDGALGQLYSELAALR